MKDFKRVLRSVLAIDIKVVINKTNCKPNYLFIKTIFCTGEAQQFPILLCVKDFEVCIDIKAFTTQFDAFKSTRQSFCFKLYYELQWAVLIFLVHKRKQILFLRT